MNTKFFFHVLVVTVLLINRSSAALVEAAPSINVTNCQSSVAPCICSSPKFAYALVTCNRVSVATVKNVFSKLVNTALISLTLTPNAKDNLIPANVIGKQKINTLILNCPNRFSNIKIDRAAFASAAQTIYSFSVSNCDLRSIDWSFLTNFTGLGFISMWASDNFQSTFNTFPSSTLSNLRAISLQFIRNMNGFSNKSLLYPPIVAHGLESVSIQNCYDFNDDALEHFLTKWVTPSSLDTLTSLYLNANSLTQIPLDVPKFSKLSQFDMTGNMQPLTIQPNAFNFDETPASLLVLNNAQIEYIEGDAFQGDFSDAQVILYSNNLEVLEEAVFLDMLTQMNYGTGYLDVGQNPLDCEYFQCSLYWLIGDNPQLLDVMWSAQCANGSYLYDLSPDALSNPDGTPCFTF